MVNLLAPEELQALIKEKCGSREWWVLFATPDMASVISAIEARFYKGPANADFEMVMGFGVVPGEMFFFAHKRRMTRQTLHSWAKGRGVAIPLAGPEQDILIFRGPDPEGQDAAREFMSWLRAMYSGSGLPVRISNDLLN